MVEPEAGLDQIIHPLMMPEWWKRNAGHQPASCAGEPRCVVSVGRAERHTFPFPKRIWNEILIGLQSAADICVT